MFNNVNFLLLEGKNKIIDMCQNSALAEKLRACPFYNYLDKAIFTALLALLISVGFLGTGAQGALALVFIMLMFVRVLLNKGEKIEFSVLDSVVLIYFLLAFLSLMGSTLFLASFKGFLKMF